MRVLTIFLISLFTSNAAVADTVGGDTLFNHSGAKIVPGVQSDSCVLCHWQTGQPIAAQSSDLCFQCHSDVAGKAAKLHRHREVVSEKYPGLSCEGCHRLHSAGARPALASNELVLCSSCHQTSAQYKTHPVVGNNSSRGEMQFVKGADGRPLTCASHCHDVHGADFQFLCRLEPGRELCLSCHKEFE